MGLIETLIEMIQGKPAQGGLFFPPTVLPPLYNAVSGWGPAFTELFNRPLPQWQGNIDPGMSPTMQNFLQMSQGFATSPMNSAMQGAQGALGRYSQPGAGMMGQGDIMSARNALMRYQNPSWMNAGSAAQYGRPTNFFGGGGGGMPMPPKPPSPFGGGFGGGGGGGGNPIQQLLLRLQQGGGGKSPFGMGVGGY